MTLVPVIAQSWILNFVHEAGLSVLSCILVTDTASLETAVSPFQACETCARVEIGLWGIVGGWWLNKIATELESLVTTSSVCTLTQAGICNGFHCNVIGSN